MLDPDKIASTGIYWNESQWQNEAWIVNQDTNEKVCIGVLNGDLYGTSEYKELKKKWEVQVFTNILSRVKF